MAKFETELTFEKNPREGERFTVGKVTVAFERGKLALNGNEVSDQGLQYIIGYGVKQSLADAYAGAGDDEEQAKASFDKKLAAVIEGTVTERGSGVSSDHQIARDLIRKAMYNNWRKAGKKAKVEEFANLPTPKQNEKLDALMAQQDEDVLKGLVKAERDRREAAAKARAATAQAAEQAFNIDA